MPEGLRSRISGCSFNLFHAPWFSKTLGTTPAAERESNPESPFLKTLEASMRSFPAVVAYPPNQVFIGNLDPRVLPEQPWYTRQEGGSPEGPFGDILDETALYGLMKYSDVFDLVLLEEQFSRNARDTLAALPAMTMADLSSLEKGVSAEEIDKAVSVGAVPLYREGILSGCVKAAHPSDINLSAHTMTENLASKATAVYALRQLLHERDGLADKIGYIIETSEEACGDMNQRGGGNFAKAVGELAALKAATGSDTRSFCAGPVHGLMQAASLVAAGTFEKVVVVAGGTTAKLAMNAKKHLEKSLPVLEDVMGSFALLVEGGPGPGLNVRLDAVGFHKIGAGSAPQAVVGNLVADPLEKAALSFSDVDVYAPEMHNPEITSLSGAGNVTLQNLKMIAAMAVMRKEITREEMDGFIAKHGVSGWAPTQGHIPSGVPALGWFLRWAEEGSFHRGLVIGKGSLFLGRMTNLFDGVSLLVEAENREDFSESPDVRVEKEEEGSVRLGCTVTGAESPPEVLREGVEAFREKDPSRRVTLYGKADPGENRRAMERDLENGVVDGALTFHYSFPLGEATVGLAELPHTGKKLFIATTTGAASDDRVEALVLNALKGKAAGRAWGLANPSVGFLNLEGAALALKKIRQLMEKGYPLRLAGSSRQGDGLLRGNDILKGTCDVVVCDSLTGNALMKLLSAYETGGEQETTGSGYGCGLSHGKPVGIISRATGAKVLSAALEYLERMIRGSWTERLREETQAAEKAGLSEVIQAKKAPAAETQGLRTEKEKKPLKVPVDAEIEGVDVLVIQEAVDSLLHEGIYCESGMGCTGPVVMVSRENIKRAERILQDRSFL
ncbi:MAG: hypothetical protein JW760_07495 [Spirochaetales bacterium]|nr:hypothetical protein [Spirochaetales bacterium]